MPIRTFFNLLVLLMFLCPAVSNALPGWCGRNCKPAQMSSLVPIVECLERCEVVKERLEAVKEFMGRQKFLMEVMRGSKGYKRLAQVLDDGGNILDLYHPQKAKREDYRVEKKRFMTELKSLRGGWISPITQKTLISKALAEEFMKCFGNAECRRANLSIASEESSKEDHWCSGHCTRREMTTLDRIGHCFDRCELDDERAEAVDIFMKNSRHKSMLQGMEKSRHYNLLYQLLTSAQNIHTLKAEGDPIEAHIKRFDSTIRITKESWKDLYGGRVVSVKDFAGEFLDCFRNRECRRKKLGYSEDAHLAVSRTGAGPAAAELARSTPVSLPTEAERRSLRRAAPPVSSVGSTLPPPPVVRSTLPPAPRGHVRRTEREEEITAHSQWDTRKCHKTCNRFSCRSPEKFLTCLYHCRSNIDHCMESGEERLLSGKMDLSLVIPEGSRATGASKAAIASARESLESVLEVRRTSSAKNPRAFERLGDMLRQVMKNKRTKRRFTTNWKRSFRVHPEQWMSQKVTAVSPSALEGGKPVATVYIADLGMIAVADKSRKRVLIWYLKDIEDKGSSAKPHAIYPVDLNHSNAQPISLELGRTALEKATRFTKAQLAESGRNYYNLYVGIESASEAEGKVIVIDLMELHKRHRHGDSNIKISPKRELEMDKVGRLPTALAYDPHGDFLYVADAHDNQMTVYSLLGKRPAFYQRFPLKGKPTSLLLTDDNLYVSTQPEVLKGMGEEADIPDGHVEVFRVKRTKAPNHTITDMNVIPLRAVKVGAFPASMTYDPILKNVFVANMLGGTVSVINEESKSNTPEETLDFNFVIDKGKIKPISNDEEPNVLTSLALGRVNITKEPSRVSSNIQLVVISNNHKAVYKVDPETSQLLSYDEYDKLENLTDMVMTPDPLGFMMILGGTELTGDGQRGNLLIIKPVVKGSLGAGLKGAIAQLKILPRRIKGRAKAAVKRWAIKWLANEALSSIPAVSNAQGLVTDRF